MKNEPENNENLPALRVGWECLWVPAPVSERPEVVLTDWSVFEVALGEDPARTRHFAGQNITDHEGRVSSEVVEFDAATGRGVTSSGRVYELRGRTGFTADSRYVWDRWRALNGAVDVVDVTAEIRGLLGR